MNSAEAAIAKYNTLSKIVEQLAWAGYETEAGVLINNVAFTSLARMAVKEEMEQGRQPNAVIARLAMTVAEQKLAGDHGV